jgi:hypothetical protein
MRSEFSPSLTLRVIFEFDHAREGTMTRPILEVHQLTKYFGGLAAIMSKRSSLSVIASWY